MFSRKHASHFNSDDAEQRQAKWREASRPEDICWPDVSVEAEMGKMYRATFTDKEGRTVVIMRPAKQNTSSHEGQLRHLIYTMENAVLSLPQGLDKMVWLVDYTGWTLANATPIKTARDSTNILQNHYPERLSVAFLFNPPKVFESFFKVIKVFLDSKSIQKVNFVYKDNEESLKTMYKHIDPEILPAEFGGKNNVVYNQEEYTKLMTKDDMKTASFWAADC
ncbi:phosphatidylinositol transfer protein PDR17 isoform X1 [Triticum aestivum]|nr:phosphatidylinositol transfer protein PDR17-like isoform X1 [Triticum aestivum]